MELKNISITISPWKSSGIIAIISLHSTTISWNSFSLFPLKVLFPQLLKVLSLMKDKWRVLYPPFERLPGRKLMNLRPSDLSTNEGPVSILIWPTFHVDQTHLAVTDSVMLYASERVTESIRNYHLIPLHYVNSVFLVNKIRSLLLCTITVSFCLSYKKSYHKRDTVNTQSIKKYSRDVQGDW